MLEIEITPNRPDCLSVVGVARELSALTGAPFQPPTIGLAESDEDVNALAHVRIEAPDLCHRFTARVISDVTVAPSPAWMGARLRAVGWEVVSPLHCPKPKGLGTGGADWAEHLRYDLVAMLSKCDVIVTLPSWRYSRGARLEVATACL